MKSKQLYPVVYTGKVGAKMRAKRITTIRAVSKTAYHCVGGPMNGETLYLSTDTTAMFNYKGETGRYVGGKWEAENVA